MSYMTVNVNYRNIRAHTVKYYFGYFFSLLRLLPLN